MTIETNVLEDHSRALLQRNGAGCVDEIPGAKVEDIYHLYQ